ncbi:MAG: DUF402 domain-containing protein [Bacilli bacterium]|nr:DUF402 domain-containing protein [Bacilli bacterium]
MKTVGRWFGIQCFKHDGTVHRTWDRGLVLDDNEDYIVVASKRAKVIETNGRRWFTKEPAVTIFSKKEWWNVICMIKEDGICFYCNIASPSIVDKDTIKYIDYDLDAKLFSNGDIRVLDQKEYIHHKEQYHYNEDLDTVLKYETDVIVKRMKNNEFPFQAELIEKYYDKFLKNTEKNK